MSYKLCSSLYLKIMGITIYTLSWCPHCNALKEYLHSKKIEYKNIDIEENEKEAGYIIEKTEQSSFPVLDIDNKIVIGFDREKIESLLKK